MKILAFIVILSFLEKSVDGRNAWETTGNYVEERELKRSKTSIVAYDKMKMSVEDAEAEAEHDGVQTTDNNEPKDMDGPEERDGACA